MTQEIRIPDIGDADDVEVVEILAAAGDRVGVDDPIIVIESDKASMEVPAGLEGVIDSITVAVGDQVSEGQVIAKLASSDDETDDESDDGPEEAGDSPDDDAADRADDAAQQEGEDDAQDDAQDDTDAGQDDGGDEAETSAEKPSGDESASAGSGTRSLEIKVPDIGEAENVEVIEVAVKSGDQVSVDDLLVVVESDKASMEIPSTHAGKILEVHVSEGSQVEAGTLLVTLESATDENAGDADKAGGDDAKTAGDDDKAAGKPPEEAAEKSGDNKSSKKDAASTEQAPKAADRAPGETSAGADVYAGPAVRRLARELGVDLGGVSGSGNRGRIVKDDVKAYVKERMRGGAAAAPAAGAGIPPIPAVDFSKFGEVEEQPLSRIRARGAENLHRSWLNLPHVTQHDEVDVTDLEQFRGTLKAEGERRGVKVTPLAFIIRACCQALKEFPTFNASLDPSARTFILKRYYNIGMAVDTPEGLVVPVIHDADRKGVWELSAEIVELAQKARDKKLGMNDAQGGSFSVSSLGAIGGTGFTPIINAPEVAILGIGRMTMRPVWRGEAFVPRQMLPLSLSYDHRAINGAEGGRFVSRLGELLSDIRRLAL